MLLIRHAIIPFVALSVLIAQTVLASHEEKGRLARIGWALPFMLTLIWLIWACVVHILRASPLSLTLLSYVLCTAGIIVLQRDRVLAKELALPDALSGVLHALKELLLLGLASLMGVFALEYAWNPFQMPTDTVGFRFELAVVFCVMLVCYLVGLRSSVLCSVFVAVLCFIGMAEGFVIAFRGLTISPSDLSGIKTAASVVSGYSFKFTEAMLYAIACAALSVCLLAFIRPRKREEHSAVVANVASVAGGLALAAVLVLLYTNVSIYQIFHFEEGWWTGLKNENYAKQGFITTFLQQNQAKGYQAPDNYTELAAQAIMDEKAAQGEELLASDSSYQAASKQFEKTKPSIVVIMNESFADLSIFDNVDERYTGPKFFKEEFCQEALAYGPLYVSPYGGQTCNSEFELICGTPLAFTGVGMPFRDLSLGKAHSLINVLNEQGYHTTLIHPNFADAWFRSQVYPVLGIDDFIDIDSFRKAEQFHSGVSDAATYEEVLKVLKTADEPQFIYDITIANHGGYDQQNIDPALVHDYVGPEGTSELELNEYIGCIERSDQDLEAFIAEVKKLDRPVVVVFFGDHQPGFTIPYASGASSRGSDYADGQRTQETVYAIWTNYEVEGAEPVQELTTSTSYLATLTLRLIGAPLDAHDRALEAFRQEIVAINTYGYQDAQGEWHVVLDENGTAKELHDMDFFYYLNFGSKV